MALQFKTIFTSYKDLANEVTRVIDLYQVSMATEKDLQDAIGAWRESAADYLLAQDGRTLAPTLARYIGKRRAAVITTLLNR